MNNTQLTPELFHDLINPGLAAIDICLRHELGYAELRDIIRSEEFKAAAECLNEIEDTRRDATRGLRQDAALRTLDQIATQPPSTPSHTETIRLAASQLLRFSTSSQKEKESEAANSDVQETTRPVAGQHASSKAVRSTLKSYLETPGYDKDVPESPSDKRQLQPNEQRSHHESTTEPTAPGRDAA